jgi:hypothetical protein
MEKSTMKIYFENGLFGPLTSSQIEALRTISKDHVSDRSPSFDELCDLGFARHVICGGTHTSEYVLTSEGWNMIGQDQPRARLLSIK